MNSFQHILFPVDLSPQCRAAAPFVRELATRFQSEIMLLHVVEVPPAWYGAPEAADFRSLVDMAPMMADRRAALECFLVEELAGVRVQRCLQTGTPAAIITSYAHQRQFGLIMMPTHGYGPFRGMLLGSVTAKVLHDAECPVWTAAHAEELNLEHARPWRRLLCALDAGPRDLRLLCWAARLAAEQGATLQLVHAVTGFDPSPDGAEDPLRDFLMNVAGERIAKLQTDAGTDLPVIIEAGGPAKVVREIALRDQADLLLIGRGVIQRPLGRLRSNAYAILRNAPCPVISV